jgi:diguanylate cyclase (GGDEF)-like protein/PAS domain S-box-containing protein
MIGSDQTSTNGLLRASRRVKINDVNYWDWFKCWVIPILHAIRESWPWLCPFVSHRRKVETMVGNRPNITRQPISAPFAITTKAIGTIKPSALWRSIRNNVPKRLELTPFVLLVCTILTVVEAIDTWAMRIRDISNAQTAAENLTGSLGRQALDTVRTVDIAILGLVQRLNIDGHGAETLEKLRQIMVARLKVFPALESFVIADATGRCLTTNYKSIPDDCTLAERADLAYHRTHEGELRLGRPERAVGSNTWVIPLSRRFNHPDGSFAGIVVIGLGIPYFNDYYNTFDIGRNGTILLALEDGTLLVRRPFDEANIGRNLHSGKLFTEFLPRRPVGIGKIKASTDGVVRYFAYRRLASYPLVVAVAVAEDDILAPWHAELWPRLSLTAVIIAIIAFLGGRLAKHTRERRRVEKAYRLLADNSTDVIMRIGPDSKRIYISPSIRDLTGHEPEELISGAHGQLIHPDDRAAWLESFGQRPYAEISEATYRILRTDGSFVWVEAVRRRLPDGGFVVCIRDISARKQAEDRLATANRQLELLARRDALTSVANRRAFDETIEAEFRRAVREKKPLSLIMIDVDNFKAFNDNYGHPAGDRCLVRIALALSELPQRPADLIARYGGEEFAILLPNTPQAGAITIAEQARSAVKLLQIEHISQPSKVVTISLGVASLVPIHGKSQVSDLISAADQALYDAKGKGRDTVSSTPAFANEWLPPAGWLFEIKKPAQDGAVA